MPSECQCKHVHVVRSRGRVLHRCGQGERGGDIPVPAGVQRARTPSEHNQSETLESQSLITAAASRPIDISFVNDPISILKTIFLHRYVNTRTGLGKSEQTVRLCSKDRYSHGSLINFFELIRETSAMRTRLSVQRSSLRFHSRTLHISLSHNQSMRGLIVTNVQNKSLCSRC